MKNTILSVVVLAALAVEVSHSHLQASLGSPFSPGQSSQVVTIRPDGICSITNTSTQPRKQLEAQVRSMEKYRAMEDGEAVGESTSSAKPAKAELEPMADEELLKKYREMYEQRGSRFGNSRDNWTVDRVERTGSNDVQVVVSAVFSSIKDMMRNGAYAWGPSVLMMDDSTVQIDTNKQFRITFSRDAESGRMSYAASQAERYLKRVRARQEWKLVLPGKIISSDFPLADNNSTSLVLDPDKPETLDAVLKLMKAPALTVVADPAGLKVNEVLRSSELAEQMRSAANEADIPITDAGPGFVTEAQTVEITTTYEFPDAKQLKENSRAMMFQFSGNSQGTVVEVKLFPPKGRIIKSASSVQVKQAKDDQGRPVPILSKSRRSSYSIHASGNREKALTVRLDMGLPEPDAKAIDEVQAEAVVLTIGGYKESVLTNAQAEIKKDIDLSGILPGAKLLIERASGKGSQKSVQLTVTGSKDVRQLEFAVGSEDPESGHSSFHDRNVTEKDGVVTRTVQVQKYEFGTNVGPDERPIELKVRMPQDYKNERLQFTLTALDLL